MMSERTTEVFNMLVASRMLQIQSGLTLACIATVAAASGDAGRLVAAAAAAQHGLDRGPGEAQADPAAARAPAARAQVPAPREPVQRRDVAVHAAALQDHEERAQPHDVMSGEPRY